MVNCELGRIVDTTTVITRPAVLALGKTGRFTPGGVRQQGPDDVLVVRYDRAPESPRSLVCVLEEGREQHAVGLGPEQQLAAEPKP